MMPVRRVAVTGGDHSITPEEERAFREALSLEGIGARVVVLHGNCSGVDQEAAKLAEKWCYPTVPFGGLLQGMIEAAHVLIAFPGGRGTADCIRQAEKKGIKVVRMEGYYSLPDRKVLSGEG
jgi:hypothetical protein